MCVNPSSVQGPGRAGGTGRFLLAFLDGRMKVFVQTNVSLVDIADCVEGHLLAAERGQTGERYLLNGMTLTLTESLALAAEVAGVQRTPRLLPRPVATVAAGAVEGGFRLVRRHPPVCREMVRTLLHGHRYDGSRAERELGLRYTDPRRDGAAHGRLGAVGWAVEERLDRRRLSRRGRPRRAGRASAARARRRARPGSRGTRPPWPRWRCAGRRSSASRETGRAPRASPCRPAAALTARSSSRISVAGARALGLEAGHRVLAMPGLLGEVRRDGLDELAVACPSRRLRARSCIAALDSLSASIGPPGSASVIAIPATRGARPSRAHSSSVKSALVVMQRR